MTHKILPRPSVLDDCIPVGRRNGRKVWKSQSGHRFFTWDSLHGEVEVFDSRGQHLGAIDPMTGAKTKSAVPGRRLDV
ncbi:MAG: colicin E3/pyocin S6 family cytotoxin [Syntrophobacteraceae bacterium]